MSKWTPRFINFAKSEMAKRDVVIRQWAKSDWELLAKTCHDIIEAAGET